ncbi:hypothetical protein QW131_14600 [Roseibium salinum]|nr:hypothetical protein [Roseibium salinum]
MTASVAIGKATRWLGILAVPSDRRPVEIEAEMRSVLQESEPASGAARAVEGGVAAA